MFCQNQSVMSRSEPGNPKCITGSRLKQQYGGTLIDFETQQKLSAVTLEKLRALPTITKVTQHDGTKVTLNATGEQALTGRVIQLVGAETEITAITQREPDLNEVFLNLTGKALRD